VDSGRRDPSRGSFVTLPAARTSPPRWLVAVAVMLATVMVILDMTIVNVALPHMMGALGTTANQITWVLTAYIVTEAVFIPLTGFFSARLGRRRLMLISVAGFIVASAMCGQAESLAEMVLFRLLQGAFGAAVVPLSQAIMVDSFPANERGKAMALWGVGIMLGPILGPTLGGYITQHLDWRWVFYINVPVGIVNFLMIARLISGAPARAASADWLGALLLTVGVGSLQTMLDRGSQEGWFQSELIVVLAAASLIGLGAFVIRAWRREDGILQLQLLKDRNLAAASFMMAVFGMGLFGVIALQPLMLERLFDYPAQTAGLVMAPRGLASAVGMFVVSRLIQRVGAPRLILLGLMLAASGTYLMTRYSLSLHVYWVIWPGVVQGLGMGMIFVSLSTVAYNTLPAAATDQGAAIFNLARTVGSAMGISVAATVLTRMTQTNWNRLGGHINPFNPALQQWLATSQLTLSDPLTARLLASELGRQASMLGFIDAYWFIMWSLLALAPLLLVLRHRSGSNVSAAKCRVETDADARE
jgi:DHA2 family multidrug resistance protein